MKKIVFLAFLVVIAFFVFSGCATAKEPKESLFQEGIKCEIQIDNSGDVAFFDITEEELANKITDALTDLGKDWEATIEEGKIGVSYKAIPDVAFSKTTIDGVYETETADSMDSGKTGKIIGVKFESTYKLEELLDKDGASYCKKALMNVFWGDSAGKLDDIIYILNPFPESKKTDPNTHYFLRYGTFDSVYVQYDEIADQLEFKAA